MDQQSPEARYLEGLRQGEILFQRDESGRAHFPPRVMAPGTGGTLTWHKAAGLGTVYAATRQPKRPPEPPTLIILVDLDEGFRMISAVEGENLPPIGSRVSAVIAREADIPHVRFIPLAPTMPEASA